MGWAQQFGAGAVAPNVVSYAALALTENVTLEWPQNAGVEADVISAFFKVTPDAAGRTITMPAANAGSNGPVTMFYNTGADSFSILDADGGLITAVAAGAVKFIVLTDQATAAGTWISFTFGTGTSGADAAALAGFGLVALLNVLNVNHPSVELASDDTATTSWRARTTVWTGGAGTITLPDTLPNGWFMLVRNAGSGALDLGATDIDGDTTVTLNPTDSCIVISDGAGVFWTVGLGRATEFAVTRLLLNVSGNTDYTESATEAANQMQEFTGTLTGNINVIVPTAVGVYYLTNATAGAFSLTVKTVAGTGVVLEQGKRAIFYCDGTNVVDAVPWRTPIANLPMGGFKFTGLGNGSAATDSAAFGQIISGAATYGADTGAANAYVVTLPTTPGAYADGQEFGFQPANSNTATSTINFNGVGALTMKRQTNAGIRNLVGGEVIQDGMCKVMIDASVGAIVLNPANGGVPVGTIIPWGGATAPAGYVFCFGQAVSRTAEPYPGLFSVWSTVWGVGDGSTTFNIADLRGRSLTGRDDMGGAAANRVTNGVSGITGTTLGAVGGDQSQQGHTHTGGSHAHLITDLTHTHNYNEFPTGSANVGAVNNVAVTGATTVGQSGAAAVANISTPNSTGAAFTGLTTTNNGGVVATTSTGNGNSQNMPPTAIVNFCVKL